MSEKLNPLPHDLIERAFRKGLSKVFVITNDQHLYRFLVAALDDIRNTPGWVIQNTISPYSANGWQGDTPRKEGAKIDHDCLGEDAGEH